MTLPAAPQAPRSVVILVHPAVSVDRALPEKETPSVETSHMNTSR